MKQSILALALFLAIFNSFALPVNWYHTVPPIDIPIHISFGALVGLLAIMVARKTRRTRIFAVVLLSVFVIGIGWEGIEFTRDTYYALPQRLPPAQISGLDTALDMANNMIGGILAYALVFYFSTRKHQKRIPPKNA